MAQSALEKVMAIAARIAEENNLDLDTNAIIHHEEIEEERKQNKVQYTNALEVIINQLHHAHASMIKTCPWCKEKFITTYCYHQFCSDECRTAEFIERFKIDPKMLTPPHSFWEYENIGVVSTGMTRNLYEWAKHLITLFESMTEQEMETLESLEEPDVSESLVSSSPVPRSPTTDSREPDSRLLANPQSMLDSLAAISFDFG